MSAKPQCKAGRCANSAVTDLAGQDLCIEHFLAGCFEHLDRLESVVCSQSMEAGDNSVASAFLEECSKRTLCLCLRHECLTNLDRSRLLNILLQASHLQMKLRRPVINRQGPVSDLSTVFFGRATGKTESAVDRKDC